MRKLDTKKLVLASHNAGKLREIGALLAPFGIDVISAADLGISEPAETEDTFAGNARIKAHHAARASGLPALSDDSGIKVDALNGAPGVYTADWAETDTGRDYNMAMAQVWAMVQEVSAPRPHHAQFHCTLCIAWPDGHDEVFDGEVPGTLVWPMRGTRGFGFDPMFLPAGKTQTFGEMDPDEKHAMSHRAVAFAKFVAGCIRGDDPAPKRRLISTGSAFETTMGYSRAVVQGDWCFVSGVTGYDYATMQMPDGVADQARNCFATIANVLDDAGFGMADIVRVQYTVTDAALMDDLVPALGAALGDIRPAATVVIAGLIKPEMKVEIEVTAFKG